MDRDYDTIVPEWDGDVNPSLEELYENPVYWQDYYSDDRNEPDNYEVWPGQSTTDNGIHLIEEG